MSNYKDPCCDDFNTFYIWHQLRGEGVGPKRAMKLLKLIEISRGCVQKFDG